MEFAFDGELNPANLLGEFDGKRGSGQTSPDLAVLFTSDGKKGLILVECKYTEHGFYNCSGRKTKTDSGKIPNPNPERCTQKVTMNNFKSNCHQYIWGRKYWDYLSVSEIGIKTLKTCPAFRGGYQLVRQQALAEGIAKSGQYEKVFSCVAFDGRNEKIMQSMKGIGVHSIKDEWKMLFNLKSDFSVWHHQKWVGFVRQHGKSKFEKEWIEYIKNRYNM